MFQRRNLWVLGLGTVQMIYNDKDGSHNWGGFAHIESMVVHCLGAHFMNIWDPSFGEIQNDLQ